MSREVRYTVDPSQAFGTSDGVSFTGLMTLDENGLAEGESVQMVTKQSLRSQIKHFIDCKGPAEMPQKNKSLASGCCKMNNAATYFNSGNVSL